MITDGRQPSGCAATRVLCTRQPPGSGEKPAPRHRGPEREEHNELRQANRRGARPECPGDGRARPDHARHRAWNRAADARVPSTSTLPSGPTMPSPVTWSGAARNPVHQITASTSVSVPSRHTTPVQVKRTNGGNARSTPRSRASTTSGAMTMAPRPPGGTSGSQPSRRALMRAVARWNSTRPSTSSGRKTGGRSVTQTVSATLDTSARICAPEFPPPTTRTHWPANGSGAS